MSREKEAFARAEVDLRSGKGNDKVAKSQLELVSVYCGHCYLPFLRNSNLSWKETTDWSSDIFPFLFLSLSSFFPGTLKRDSFLHSI